MAINFTKNVEQYTTAQKSTRAKKFTEFTSKKQLENAEVLTADQLSFVKSIKGTFSFSLHEGERYMAVTLYKASAEKKYNFLVVDLQESAIAEVDSIKQAKAEILELVAGAESVEQEAQEEQVQEEPAAEEEVAPEEESAPAEEPVEKPARKRRNKNQAEEA